MPRLPERDLDHVLKQAGECWPAFAGSRLFITGGTGFVGKWLLESLLWANDRLHLNAAITVLTRDPQRFQLHSPHLASHSAVELLRGDMTSFEFPSGEFPFVIHASTAPSIEANALHPTGAFDLDVAGTRRVLEFACTHGTKRLLFTSSGAIYGIQPPELSNMPEDYPGAPSSTNPASAYGQAKRVSEFLCTTYARQYGFDALIARLFAFSGPYLPLDLNFAIGNFVRDALQDEPIRVKGDGTPYRSYLYAADMAAWLWTILARGESARPYNVGSGEAVSIAEVAATVANMAERGTRVEIACRPAPGIPAARYVPSVRRTAEELGLKVSIPFEEGVQRMMEWARSAKIGDQKRVGEKQAI